ncbi:MAG: Gfo/Idh/MocA family oxidoreductase [Betaproteobacteria bacterium]|nr:Gfo/Idh/MocA family oxidoreductase [Betaproteobacteria bacterium]
MSATKSVGWGVVGLGWVANDFVGPAIDKSAGSRIVACLGSTPQKTRAYAEKFKVKTAPTDLNALLHDPGVDAVYIALPNALHHEAVLAGARAQKNMLCEKPFAMRADHAREMAAACKAAGVVLRIAHQIRMDAAVARAREIALSGRLGKIVAVEVERTSASPPRKTWRADNTQSGVMYDVGVHLLDLAQWVTGQKFVEVSAFTHPDRRDGHADDTFSVLGRLHGGAHARVRATREVAHGENNLLIEGSEATLVTSALRWATEHVVTVRDKNGATVERFAASPAYEWQIQSFEGELRGRRGNLPDGEDSAYTVAVTNAILQSIDERRIVPVTA